MFREIMDAVFGCSHNRTTFPVTPTKTKEPFTRGPLVGTYVACLDCGKRFAYDWATMKVGKKLPRIETPPSISEKELAG